MDTGWIHHYRKLLSGRGYVLNWELQKASQLAKRNKKYITKATQTVVMIIPPHVQREVHEEEQACSKLEGDALPLATDHCSLSLQLTGRTVEWWRAGQDSSCLCICGIPSLEACWNHDWVNSSVTITELLSLELLPRLSTIPFIPVSKSCPFIPSLDSFGHQKSINRISWKQKRGASQGAQVQSKFSGRDMEKKEEWHMHAVALLPHALEQRGHCTSPTTSAHGHFLFPSPPQKRKTPKHNRT